MAMRSLARLLLDPWLGVDALVAYLSGGLSLFNSYTWLK